jgi:hypothetical protein
MTRIKIGKLIAANFFGERGSKIIIQFDVLTRRSTTKQKQVISV